MTAGYTLDSNILVYAFDRSAGRKHDLALTIVDLAFERRCLLLTQALCEFFSVVTQKGMAAPAEAAAQVTDWMTALPVSAPDPEAIRLALEHAVARRLSFWDAILVATAWRAGCGLLLSEDMQDGGQYGGVVVVNPFRPGGLPTRLRAIVGID